MAEPQVEVVEALREIDRKLASIMQVQDAQMARLSALKDQLDVLVPPPEGSVAKYTRQS